VPVCAPVSFNLPQGRAVALVGANGAGKSTVLRAVIGLLEPAGGTLTVLGAPPDERSVEFRTKVSSVLDDDAYFPGLTVAEHLYLTARGHAMLGARELVTELLDEFGLSEHSASLPTALSSGQRRRLLLAAGFVRPRSLLVLDEPEQRLDLRMRQALADRLNAEKEAGGTVLMATHDATLVREVADRAVYVDDDSSPLLTADEAAARIEVEP
jgi:ABC-type multidrug transport system ATPase subunit